MPEGELKIQPPSRKGFKKFIWVLIVALAGTALYLTKDFYIPKFFGLRKSKATQKTESTEPARVPLKTFKVGRFNYEDSLNALGTIKGAIEFKLRLSKMMFC
jgi:hypothetical protein